MRVTKSLSVIVILLGLVACSGGSEVSTLPLTPSPKARPDTPQTKASETIEDTYLQKRSKKVDILWVVDDSRSMEENQFNLARNFQSFVNQFLNQEELPDFQMAVVTTDPEHQTRGDGRFFKGKILKKSDADQGQEKFIEDFQKLIRVGINGSREETSLRAILRATQRQPDFFRKEALLIVNIISDEKDSSINYKNNGMNVKDFVDAIKQFKTGQRVVINSIVHFHDKSRDETAGKEQLEATLMTDGVSEEIENDFGNSLSVIGDMASQLVSSFPLTEKTSDPTSIKVSVNSKDIKSGWEYDNILNSVVFKKSPIVGSIIKISYTE